jgi:hypothetical protein
MLLLISYHSKHTNATLGVGNNMINDDAELAGFLFDVVLSFSDGLFLATTFIS